MRLNPAIESAPGYPFLRVAEARRRAQEQGRELLDLTLGQPTDPAPAVVRESLARDAAELQLCEDPLAAGLPALRDAIAAWIGRRFGAAVDPAREVLPTLGAKEPIPTLARLFARPGEVVSVGTPSYPVPERSAGAAGLEVSAQCLGEDGGWLPDPDAVPWGRAAIVWVVNPHNPTGALAPAELIAELAERCRESGAILAVDETYSEFCFDGAAVGSALELADRRGVVVFNSLSKRSGLAGLRCGFIAGDAEIVSRMARHRSDVGTTPPLLVQRAAIAAWQDERHVQEAHARYAERRVLLSEAARRGGMPHAGGPAGIFLWLRVPGGDDVAAFQELIERSLLVVPGSYLGAGGEGYLRVSLTPPLEKIERAARAFEQGLSSGGADAATATRRAPARAR